MNPPGRIDVLIVDDDAVDRTAVICALRNGGFQVKATEAADVSEARAALEKGSFDCILCNLVLPGGDGFDILEAARIGENPSPVIMLTAQRDESQAVELMNRGASDYCPKSSITAARLTQSVLRAIRLRSAENGVRDARRDLEMHASRLKRLVDAGVRIHAVNSRIRTSQEIVALATVLAVEARELVGAHHSLVQFDSNGSGDSPIVASASSSDHLAGLVVESLLGETLRVAILDRHGNAIGSLSLVASANGRFSSNDETLLTELTQTASIALDNSRLLLEAKEAGASRDEMISLVSHDLRNPMSTIAMSASLLRESASVESMDSKRQLALVERIERALAKMDRVIDDLLAARVSTSAVPHGTSTARSG